MSALIVWPIASLLALYPPAAREARAQPEADTLKTSVGLTLKRIPAGTFLMGLGPGDLPPAIVAIFENERPQHLVTISKAFYLGIYEVTQREYKQVLGANPSKFRQSDKLPVEQVTWLEAITFCNALSEREGRKPYYQVEGDRVSVLGGSGFRLPTEAEWEYACRAGTTTPLPFEGGDAALGKYAWYEGNSGGKTHPVGGKRPNRFGLHDMLGNVFEWCGDRFTVDYYKQSPDTDPPGPSRSDLRVLRGCAGSTDAAPIRSAYRTRDLPNDRHRYPDHGFRVAAAAE